MSGIRIPQWNPHGFFVQVLAADLMLLLTIKKGGYFPAELHCVRKSNVKLERQDASHQRHALRAPVISLYLRV